MTSVARSLDRFLSSSMRLCSAGSSGFHFTLYLEPHQNPTDAAPLADSRQDPKLLIVLFQQLAVIVVAAPTRLVISIRVIDKPAGGLRRRELPDDDWANISKRQNTCMR
jgi:hypothetical protein